MPVFDIRALATQFARFLILGGTIAFIVASVVKIKDMIKEILGLISTTSADLSNSLASGSNGCFGYAIHELGIDTFITSSSIMLFGIFATYAGMIVQIQVIRYSMLMRSYLLKGTSG